MFTFFDKKEDQKELFFQLKSALNISTEDDIYSVKVGVYAIFKNDICLYVGQSKNLPSRIATHISGKYKNFDEILIFNSLDGNDIETDNLIEGEKAVIQLLKPIENIIADYSEDINVKKIFESKISNYFDIPIKEKDIRREYGYKIIRSCRSLFISDNELSENIYTNDNIRNILKKEIINVEKHKGISDGI